MATVAFEKPLVPRTAFPDSVQQQTDAPALDISVVFTSVRWTLNALRKAAALADGLRARITLIVPQVVPYPLPLESPPVLLDFNERHFFTIVNENRIETTVRIYLCRDRVELLSTVLRPHSLVVLGGRKRWLPTRELRLAKRLRRIGLEVMVVEGE